LRHLALQIRQELETRQLATDVAGDQGLAQAGVAVATVINIYTAVRWSREPKIAWTVARKGRPGWWWIRNQRGHEREVPEHELEAVSKGKE
jgi:hypothetical protein